MNKRWKITAIVVTAVVLILAIVGVVLAQGTWGNDTANAGNGRGQGNWAVQRGSQNHLNAFTRQSAP